MNEFDRLMKHELHIKYYLRYCDDFVILSSDKCYLEELIEKIESFLQTRLRLRLHENKVEIRKLGQGIDFLGYVVRPHCTTLRTKTKKRMIRKVNKENLSSYTGILSHCNGYELKKEIVRKVQKQ